MKPAQQKVMDWLALSPRHCVRVAGDGHADPLLLPDDDDIFLANPGKTGLHHKAVLALTKTDHLHEVSDDIFIHPKWKDVVNFEDTP